MNEPERLPAIFLANNRWSRGARANPRFYSRAIHLQDSYVGLNGFYDQSHMARVIEREVDRIYDDRAFWITTDFDMVLQDANYYRIIGDLQQIFPALIWHDRSMGVMSETDHVSSYEFHPERRYEVERFLAWKETIDPSTMTVCEIHEGSLDAFTDEIVDHLRGIDAIMAWKEKASPPSEESELLKRYARFLSKAPKRPIDIRPRSLSTRHSVLRKIDFRISAGETNTFDVRLTNYGTGTPSEFGFSVSGDVPVTASPGSSSVPLLGYDGGFSVITLKTTDAEPGEYVGSLDIDAGESFSIPIFVLVQARKRARFPGVMS